MQHPSRAQSWEQEVAETKATHHKAHELAQVNSKFIKAVVDKLSKAGIDLNPLIKKHAEELAKMQKVEMDKLIQKPKKTK
jgi:hypothetical protein